MITLLSGTNRPGSATARVARNVALAYDALGIGTTTIDLRDLPPALFLPDAYARKPERFAPYQTLIDRASGLVVITPEYNGSFPGVLKVFIDHLAFPRSLDRLPVCLIGLADGQWGALRAVEHLQQIFAYRNAHLFPERVLLPHIGEAFEDGETLSSVHLGRLTRQAAGFDGFCQCVRFYRDSVARESAPAATD